MKKIKHIISAFFEQQNKTLDRVYRADSDIQFRAANMCHIMAAFTAITFLLLIFAITFDGLQLSSKRMFYASALGIIIAILCGLYVATLRGQFRGARFAYMALNVVYFTPAILLNGGLQNSAAAAMLPLPVLYSFCLYGGKTSIRFTLGFGIYTLALMVGPVILGIELPNFSQGENMPHRGGMTILILMFMTAFALSTFDHANKRALARAHDAAKAKSQFLANMSHEIRTPMNGVLGISQILMTKPMPQEQKDLLRIIHSSGESLLTIINDILDFSKLDADQVKLDPEPFDLKVLIQDIRELLIAKAEEKSIYLKLVYSQDCPKGFIGDDDRLRQVILNLTGNAIKFTQTGGVTIKVSHDHKTRLTIDITDTGIGIAPEKIDQIFEQFSQADKSTSRNFGGTGLGLSISRKIARAMGGDILVKSKPGEGSTFSVHLPLLIDTDAISDTSTYGVDLSEPTDQPEIIFLSQTDDLYACYFASLSEAGYPCNAVTTYQELLFKVRDIRQTSDHPPIVIINWERPAESFVPVFEKLRSHEIGQDLNFLLCLPEKSAGELHLPPGIGIIYHPLDASTILRGIDKINLQSPKPGSDWQAA